MSSRLLVVGLTVFLARAVWAGEFTNPKSGYRLTYPDGWNASAFGEDGEPSELMSFAEFLHGGVLAEGGAHINVRVLPADKSGEAALGELILGYEGRIVCKRDFIHRTTVYRLKRTITLGSISYEADAIAARIDGKQFLFQLEYWSGDPSAARWEQHLTDVVASVAVIPSPVSTAQEVVEGASLNLAAPTTPAIFKWSGTEKPRRTTR